MTGEIGAVPNGHHRWMAKTVFAENRQNNLSRFAAFRSDDVQYCQMSPYEPVVMEKKEGAGRTRA